MNRERRCPRCDGRIAEQAACVNGHRVPDPPYERLAELLTAEIDLDALADKIAERLNGSVADVTGQRLADDQLVDAAEIARMTSMSRQWVYDNKETLGVVRAGTGPRPRLLFDPRVVRARMAGGSASDAGVPRAVREHVQQLEGEVPLLPVKGRAA